MVTVEFETIIVCRPIIDLRFKGGWAVWLKKFSMEDDGHLSLISAMSWHGECLYTYRYNISYNASRIRVFNTITHHTTLPMQDHGGCRY